MLSPSVCLSVCHIFLRRLFGKYPSRENERGRGLFFGTTMLLFSLLIVGASALRLGAPTGAGSALRTRASSRTCGQPHMGLAVGDQFPAEALKSFGVSGKKAVVFFYGADDAPSCKKELAAFDEFMDDFKSLGATVVGVRNAAGAKGADEVYSSMKIVVDDGDEVREQIGIEKDLFGLLGGRETYVIGPKGDVVGVHNNQFAPETHIATALTALESMPASSGFAFPDLSSFFPKSE